MRVEIKKNTDQLNYEDFLGGLFDVEIARRGLRLFDRRPVLFLMIEESIDEAQERKLDHICRKLRLKSGERMLDIG